MTTSTTNSEAVINALNSRNAVLSIAGVYVDWYSERWRVITATYYVDVALDPTARDESFISGYVQAERQFPHGLTVFGRWENSSRMQESSYVALFDDHDGDIDIALRRNALGLRWDYARRQALTVELSHVVSLHAAIGRNSPAMERGRSVKKTGAKWLLALLCSVAVVLPSFADETVVLIVSAESKVEQLDSLEVRKLFLGMTVTHNGDRLRPLLNEADPRLKDVFLQNIVSMTDMTYDRRILLLALQGGRSLPTVYTNTTMLINSVAADPTAVSFAWAKDVQRDKRIKMLRVLWHD